MALTTISTLLSSQRTNTHHHEPHCVERSRATCSEYMVPCTMSTRETHTPPRPSRRQPRGASDCQGSRCSRPSLLAAGRRHRGYGAPSIDVNAATSVLGKRLKTLNQSPTNFPAQGWCFGGVLLSHTLAGAVPSALEGLASGFGMGPGVSPPLWPP